MLLAHASWPSAHERSFRYMLAYSYGPCVIQVGSCYYLSPTEHRDFFLVTASRCAYYAAISVQTFMLFYFRDLVGSKVGGYMRCRSVHCAW